ncbi:hypothetical protein ACKKBG_A29995 [Auxenochlorella protothecoides x Auxenochlorella symbiontica]
MGSSLALRLQLRAVRSLWQGGPACSRPAKSMPQPSLITTRAVHSSVDPPDVRKLAAMAHLDLEEDQVEGLTKELTSIVDWFSQLQAIDVEGVPPALQADVDSQDWQRPDEPHTFENRESLVSQFPATEGPFLSVPRTAPGTSEG